MEDDFKELDESTAIVWDGKHVHHCNFGSGHGIFVIGTTCGLVIDTYKGDWGSTWELNEATCPKCIELIASTYPLCILCKTNRAHTKYCDPCCSKHFEEQKLKHGPDVNPMYWDRMPGEDE